MAAHGRMYVIEEPLVACDAVWGQLFKQLLGVYQRDGVVMCHFVHNTSHGRDDSQRADIFVQRSDELGFGRFVLLLAHQAFAEVEMYARMLIVNGNCLVEQINTLRDRDTFLFRLFPELVELPLFVIRESIATRIFEGRRVFEIEGGIHQDDRHALLARHGHHMVQIELKVSNRSLTPFGIAVVIIESTPVIEQGVYFFGQLGALFDCRRVRLTAEFHGDRLRRALYVCSCVSQACD